MTIKKIGTVDDQMTNGLARWGYVSSNPNNPSRLKINGIDILVGGATYTWPPIYYDRPIQPTITNIKFNDHPVIVEGDSSYPGNWLDPDDRKFYINI